MNIELEVGIIGAAAAIGGTILGSLIQWRFVRRQERKEGKRFLIELKANIVKQLYIISRQAILLRRSSYYYNFDITTYNKIQNREISISWNEYEIDNSRIHTNNFESLKQKYFDVVIECYEPISTFVSYTKNYAISNIFKKVYDFDKDKFKSLLTISTDDYLAILETDELNKSDDETKKELESLFDSLRLELDKEINKYN